MKTNLLTAMRNSQGFSRTIAYLIALAVIGVVLERTIYYTLLDADIIEAESPIDRLYRVAPQKARQLGLPNPNQTAAVKEKTSDAKLSASILKTRDTLDVLAYELHRDDGDASKAQQQLTELHRQLQTQDEQAMAGFQKVGRHIEKHQLAAIIKERHQSAVESYRKDMDILLNNLQTALTSKDSNTQFEAVMAARKHLEGKQLERSQQPFDPNNLPHKSMQPNPDNKPKMTVQEFADAGLVNNPLTQYASHGSYNFGNLAGASNPAYLAETDEVKITPAIQAKADELQHDPVLIYNWVRNNIEWIPSWGAMQDSDITLGSQRGNAMDIASLLIALYRASGIPSRYVHGTIELPADKFRNWAGGFESTEAAADFAASGGIPTGIGIEGGVATTISMEHIWVEAAIDYQPSRGAINRDADSWVQMDASFKQYAFLAGLDVVALSGIDAQQLATDFVNSGTVNSDSITGLDASILQAAQQQSRVALENYITTNLSNATVGDVIGGRRIITATPDTLPSSLPNDIQVLGVRYAQIPGQLQASLSIKLGSGLTPEGLPIEPVSIPWARINSYKLTLSFRPATAADEQMLLSLLPDGGVTDISQLPTSVPAYLINMIPELKLNDEIIENGSPLGLGTELLLTMNTFSPSYGTKNVSNYVIAGAYLNIFNIAGTVSPKQLLLAEEKLNNVTTILNSGTQAEQDQINKDDLYGLPFYSGMLNYFSRLIAFSHTSGSMKDIRQGLLPSNGLFGYVPKVQLFFGLPREVNIGTVEMDIDNVSTFTADLSNNKEDVKDFVYQVGIMSSVLEHFIPEEMFVTNEGVRGAAISAIKALNIAASEGQPIYSLTSSNIDARSQDLNLDSLTMSNIQAAVAAGQTVIAHQDSINYFGWTGSGYIVLDEATGSAAFMISDGTNGASFFFGAYVGFLLIFGSLLFMIGTVAVGPAAIFAWLALIGFVLAIVASFATAYVMDEESLIFDNGCFISGFLTVIGGFVNIVGVIGAFAAIAGGLLATKIMASIDVLGWVIGLGSLPSPDQCYGSSE